MVSYLRKGDYKIIDYSLLLITYMHEIALFQKSRIMDKESRNAQKYNNRQVESYLCTANNNINMRKFKIIGHRHLQLIANCI